MKSPTLTTLGLCLLTLAPAHADPTDFGAGNQIGRVAGQPELSGDLRRLYATFRRGARYFAAFAVNHDTGHGFYTRNFHDLNRAKVAALEGCRQLSAATGCALYAVALPKSLPLDQQQAAGYSEEARDDFYTRYQDHRKPGTYAAFAVSGASHYGFGNAYDSEADARDTALSYCQIGVARDMAEIGPEGRKFIRARGWQNCKVVEVTFTPTE